MSTDKKASQKLVQYIENNTLRLETSRRGGGIEIDLSDYLQKTGAKMTAYQNYLGGGMLGSIGNSFNFNVDLLQKAKYNKLQKMIDVLNRYFHAITNDEVDAYDDWSSDVFEAIQNRPSSAY